MTQDAQPDKHGEALRIAGVLDRAAAEDASGVRTIITIHSARRAAELLRELANSSTRQTKPIAWIVEGTHSGEEVEYAWFWTEGDAMHFAAGNGGVAVPLFRWPPFAPSASGPIVAWIHPNGVTTATDQQYQQMAGTTRALWTGAIPLYAAAVAEGGKPKDDVPLRCEVVDGAIQFVIGAKILAHATNICPELYDAENDRGSYRVTNHAVFAEAVAHELNDEREDGSTLLTRMLDAAVEEAINQGAEGVEELPSGPGGGS